MALPDLKDQFIALNYGGLLHTSNQPLSTAEIRTIFDGRGNESSVKIGSVNNGMSVSGCLSADCVQVGGDVLIDYIYPVGSVLFSASITNPSVRFSGTSWVRIAEGKFIAGVGTGTDKNLNDSTIESGNDTTVGEYSHTLSVDEIPAHNHKPKARFMSSSDDSAGSSGYMGSSTRDLRDANQFMDDLAPPSMEISNTGGGEPHNNTPPYYGLYVWERTS